MASLDKHSPCVFDAQHRAAIPFRASNDATSVRCFAPSWTISPWPQRTVVDGGNSTVDHGDNGEPATAGRRDEKR